MKLEIVFEINNPEKTGNFRGIQLYNGIFVRANKTYFRLVSDVIDMAGNESGLIEMKYKLFREKYSGSIERPIILTYGQEIPPSMKHLLTEIALFIVGKPSKLSNILQPLIDKGYGDLTFTPLSLYKHIMNNAIYDEHSKTAIYRGKIYTNVTSIEELVEVIKPPAPLFILTWNGAYIYFPGSGKIVRVVKS